MSSHMRHGTQLNQTTSNNTLINDIWLQAWQVQAKLQNLTQSKTHWQKNEAFRNFITACPTHNACKLVNGVTIHRMFGINPADYSYEY